MVRINVLCQEFLIWEIQSLCEKWIHRDCQLTEGLLTLSIFEPPHEIMALLVFRKRILQTRMRSYPVGLDVWVLVGSFFYSYTSCVLAWAFAGRLCDKYHNLMSWLFSLQSLWSKFDKLWTKYCLHYQSVSKFIYSVF